MPKWLEVPLDKEVIILAKELNLPDWVAPALRLMLLIGELPEKLELRLPEYLIAPFGSQRGNEKKWLYWQTFLAYMEAIGERRMKKKKGKRGLLLEAAKILEKKYGWDYFPDSYTVRRYLDRAEKNVACFDTLINLRGGSYGKNVAKFTSKS